VVTQTLNTRSQLRLQESLTIGADVRCKLEGI